MLVVPFVSLEEVGGTGTTTKTGGSVRTPRGSSTGTTTACWCFRSHREVVLVLQQLAVGSVLASPKRHTVLVLQAAPKQPLRKITMDRVFVEIQTVARLGHSPVGASVFFSIDRVWTVLTV